MLKFSLFYAGAAALFLSACASSRSLDESFSDLSASTELRTALFSDRSYDYSDIDITMHEGRLLLTGTMRSEDGRRKLIENAWRADDVDQVIDEIFVGDKTPFGQGFEDTRIDQVLRAKLIADNDVVSGNYKIVVSRAIVYLIGTARDEMELQETLALAQSVAGVEKVVNHVAQRDEVLIK